MTPQQKQLVSASWARVVPHAEATAALFYQHLFECHPELEPLFKGDMQAQGRKLMTMINTAVLSLDNLAVLSEPLRRSGGAHAGFGVSPADYDKVGEALLWTLRHGMGTAFTAETEAAWREAYATLARVMLEGAE